MVAIMNSQHVLEDGRLLLVQLFKMLGATVQLQARHDGSAVVVPI